MSDLPRITVVGGTGALGNAIAVRLASAGAAVVIGSRDGEKAAAVGRAMSEATGASVTGTDNASAAQSGEIVFVTVPSASQVDTLRAVRAALEGKIVVDATVPLVPPKVARVQLPPEGSAARRAAATLGEGVRLVTGFHTVSAKKLAAGGAVDGDILLFGDDVAARQRVVDLCALMGVRGLHGGVLDNAVAAEAMTSVLIAINKRYGVAEGAVIKVGGVEEASAGVPA